jgi:hypothetical protein
MMRRKPIAIAFGVALLCAVLWPLMRPDQRDDFPFSTFPMFSWGREDPLARVEHVVAVFADSRREALPPSRDKNSHPRFGAAGRVSPARIDANRV